MSKILVHIHSGKDLKNKLTLGLLVAVTSVKEGHEVKLFLAADAAAGLGSVTVSCGDDEECREALQRGLREIVVVVVSFSHR